MRAIKQTPQFRSDLHRESKKQPKPELYWQLAKIIQTLANDEPLGSTIHDYALVGDWKDHHELHLRSDLILIYRKVGASNLHLVRLAPYAELSL